MPTVVLADDAPSVRALLRELFELDAGLTVVAEAGDGESAVAAVAEHRPDLAVFDVRMPMLDGLAAVSKAKAASPGTRMFLLSGDADPALADAAVRAGAEGLLVKGGSLDDLVSALQAAVA